MKKSSHLVIYVSPTVNDFFSLPQPCESEEEHRFKTFESSQIVAIRILNCSMNTKRKIQGYNHLYHISLIKILKLFFKP